jgi:hypothetical protein
VNSLPRRSAAETVPVARLAWIAGALATAAQPGRVAIGFLAAVLLWVPGLAWDRAAGPTVDPPGLLAEPWDDVERDEAQRTLRRMAAINVPEIDFEGAILPAEDLAAVLEARADELGLDPQAERVRAAARRAATLAPLGAFRALAVAESDAVSAVVDGVLALDVRPVAAGFRAAAIDVPVAAFRREPLFACAFGAWAVLVLVVAAGAVARMEVVQVAGRGTLGARQALEFAAGRWSALVLSWLAPLAIAGALGAGCWAWGLLFRTSAGGWVGSVLYLVPLAVGGVAGLALVIAALGAPTSPAAVACDGLEAMEASQRGAIYFLARPVLWVASMLGALLTIAVGLVVLRVFGWALSAFPAMMVDLGAAGAAPVHSIPVSPGRWSIPLDARSALVWWSVMPVAFAVAGATLSLVVGALTRAYLAMRECCDGQPVDASWPYEVPIDVTDAPRAPAA